MTLSLWHLLPIITATISVVICRLIHRRLLERQVAEFTTAQQKLLQEQKETGLKLQEITILNQQLNRELTELRTQNFTLASAQGEVKRLEEALNELKAQQSEWQQTQQQLASLHKEKELLLQEKQTWQQQQAQSLGEITEGLLEKTSKHTSETHQAMLESLEKVMGNLKSLSDDVSKNSANCNYLQNALLFPGSNHNFSEVTLENLLRQSGLQQKYSLHGSGDFMLQAYMPHINDEDGKTRKYYPDAIVKMPSNQYIIIDSKSSKAFGAYCQNLQRHKSNHPLEDSQELNTLKTQLHESFRKHINDLKNKNYAQVVQENFGKSELSPGQSVQITTCLFVQTDAALATLEEFCPTLTAEARDAKIFLVGPTLLNYLLDLANHSISIQRQEENFAKVKREIGTLINNISSLIKNFSLCGKKLYEAVDSYNNSANLINRHFGLRTNNILKLGFTANKAAPVKNLPAIPTMNISMNNLETLLDVTAETVAEQLPSVQQPIATEATSVDFDPTIRSSLQTETIAVAGASPALDALQTAVNDDIDKMPDESTESPADTTEAI